MNIVTEPAKILHQQSKKVKKFDKKLADLALEMIEIMRENNGVGLSAVQVGKLIRISVIEYKLKNMDEKCIKKLRAEDEIPLTILINPKVTKFSREKYTADEGCLSLPKLELPIKRSCEVNVLAQDLSGNKIKIRARNFFARVLQHEIDHTNGILITDYVKKFKRQCRHLKTRY